MDFECGDDDGRLVLLLLLLWTPPPSAGRCGFRTTTTLTIGVVVVRFSGEWARDEVWTGVLVERV